MTAPKVHAQRTAAGPGAAYQPQTLPEPAQPMGASRPVSRAWLSELAPFALLAILPFLLFWRLWWPDPAQRRSLGGDFVEQYYPMRAFVAYELRHARLPLWDPYTYAGQPAAGASLYAPFYPGGLWETLLPDPLPFEALELEAVAHLALAGIFTYLLVRRLTGRSGAGLVSGAAFSLGGYLTSYPMPQLLILETAAWLPAGLWLLDGALEKPSFKWAALAGLAFGCALLAGHPQTFLYIAYLAAAYFVWRAWQLRVGWRRAVLTAAVVGGIAAGLGALQWLPTLELSRLTPRAHLSYEELANGFRAAEIWGLLRPNAGQPSPLYVGLAPILLAGIGLALGRRTGAWFWGGTAGAALLLSLGGNGFLYPLAYRYLPGFTAFRNQERAAVLVSFALCVLAGYGYSALARWYLGRETSKRPGFAYLSILIVAITFLDLQHANGELGLQTAPPHGNFPATRIVAHVQAVSLPGWRTSSEGTLPGDGNAGSVYRLRDVAGNSPLHLAAYDEFLKEVPELRWWYLLDVQHVITRRTLAHGALKLVAQEADLRLYQVFLQAQPAWVVHRYRVATGQAAAIRATADPALDPKTEAVLETEPGALPAAETLAAGAEGVQITSFAPGRVTVDARVASAGLLVTSEIAYPGWTAYVRAADGAGPAQRPPGLRAFGLLRAVMLPAGHWQVEWRYEPASVRLGGSLAALALAAAAGILIGARHE